MHADTAFAMHASSAQPLGTLLGAAAQTLVSLLPVTTLSVSVSIIGIVIICPAGGVLG